ncbi:hypothetical protein RugamoR57_21290 [Duganella caerulea]|uniref:hypothetical protein n=1 Tax=Duganella caerulea TaxID=2885762 RepID=UPI0030E89AD5
MKRVLCALLSLLMMPAVSAQQRSDDSLGPLTHCFDGSKFKVGSRDRLPVTKKWRQVDSAGGKADVSLDDGYRLLLFTDGPNPVVNLKLERAAPGRVAADRDAIFGQMQFLVAQNPKDSTQFFSSEQGDIEHLTVRKTAMDGHGIANMETLIQQRTSTVATAYLIDTNPAGFEALRGEFLSLLSACMEKQ